MKKVVDKSKEVWYNKCIKKEREETKMKLTTVVKVVNGFVLVDTCFTFDCGYETMAFPCTAEGEVLDWGDVYCRRYADAISAAFGHEIACAELVSLVLG